jgi:hypothetical protein
VAIDYEALFGSEDYDPCAALVVIRPAYMRLRVEKSVQRVTFRDRTVEYHAAQLVELGALVAQLESECAALRGRTKPRFAITAGGRYRRG